jgi:hypothetical protein
MRNWEENFLTLILTMSGLTVFLVFSMGYIKLITSVKAANFLVNNE